MKSVIKEKKQIFWVLIYTKAREEKKANENLQKQGFKTFLPLIPSSNKKSKSKSMVTVFPRYLFVQINFEIDNWAAIKSSYGVSNIVMFSDEFTPVPDNVVEYMQHKLSEKGIYEDEISIIDYKEGDTVSIKEGRFAGIDAIFLSKKSKDRVRLLLKLLNTSVVAEINATDIENRESVKKFKL